MPICDCGLPHSIITQTPGSAPVVQNGRDLLVVRGPSIAVDVGFEAGLFETDPAKVSATVNSLNLSANLSFRLVSALIDTGAMESCVDEDLAKELQLPLIDKGKCSGVGGPHELNVYMGHIRIVPLNFIQYGRFVGAKLREGGQMHQALLGRTLLQNMILNYDGRTGAVTLSI